MEAFLIAAGVVALVLFNYSGIKRKIRRRLRPRFRLPPDIRRPPTRAATRQGSSTRARDSAGPDSFDASAATPVRAKYTLTGPAYIVDGDTIRIKKTQIRLFGMDAPEMNHPYGKRSKWALHALCKGQTIRAEVTDVDAHGRTVAQCFLPDGRDLSAEMVRQGLAIDWPKFSGGLYRHLEPADARKKMFLADARQKGQMHVWERFDAKQKAKKQG